MTEQLPINSGILKWARTTMGLSIDQVAKIMKKSPEIIQEWEKGSNSPTYPQLEKLSFDVYKRPIAVFFFPEIPEEETPKTDFRSLPNIFMDKLPAEIIKMYRKAKIFHINLEELLQHEFSNTFLNDITFNIETDDLFALTGKVRETLGISLDKQFNWKNPETAFKEWRTSFETNGIFIFKDAFKNDNFSGFCLHSPNIPIIYVNNSQPPTRQIFTLFHELAHLLLNYGGIDFRSNESIDFHNTEYEKTEKFCNSFANSILVPKEAFMKENLDISENNFIKLSQKYSVSKEVILRSFLNNQIIEAETYTRYASQWEKDFLEKSEKKESHGNYYYNQIAYLGEKYINIVFSQYYQNKISSSLVAEYLNIKEKSISSFENYVYN